jgi:hypothetical protein
MLRTVDWLLQDKIILVDNAQALTVYEIQQSISEVLDLIDYGNPPVHLIMDLTDVSLIVPSVAELLRIPEMGELYTHRSLSWTMYVGNRQNPAYQLMAAIVAQNFRARIRWADTRTDALTFLAEMDSECQVALSSH